MRNPQPFSPIDRGQDWVVVEAKQYSEPVKFEFVTKMMGVGFLCKIHSDDMLFVTTSSYTPRCYSTGLKLVDGETLYKYVSNQHLYWYQNVLKPLNFP